MSSSALVLSDADVTKILLMLSAHSESTQSLQTFIAALSDALHTFSTTSGEIHQPFRSSLTTKHGAVTLFMPASDSEHLSVKVVTMDPANPSPQGTVTIFKANGELRGILNAAQITAFRTALVSIILLVERIKAGMAVEKIVVFGTGKQAVWAVNLCLMLIPTLDSVTVVYHSSKSFFDRGGAKELLPKLFTVPGHAPVSFSVLGVERDAVALRQRIETSDAIFCCTPATEPLFPVEWLDNRARYVSLIGSYKPEMKEIDPEFLKREGVQVVVDDKEACLIGAGEIIDAGLSTAQLTELGEIVGGEKKDLDEKWKGTVVFKCVGMAIMDLVIAREILDCAKAEYEAQRFIGVEVPDF